MDFKLLLQLPPPCGGEPHFCCRFERLRGLNSRPSVCVGELSSTISRYTAMRLQLTPPRGGERSESPQSRSSFNSRLRVGANRAGLSTLQHPECFNSRPLVGANK